MAINITARQRVLLRSMLGVAPQLTVEWDEARGIARHLRTTFPAQGRSPEESLKSLLDSYGELLGPPGLYERLEKIGERRDALGYQHVSYQLMSTALSGPLEVYGARVIAHYDREQRLVAVQSSCPRALPSPEAPRLAAEDARRVARDALRGFADMDAAEAALRARGVEGFPFQRPPRLVIYPWRQRLRLAWMAYGYGVEDRRERSRRTRPRPESGVLFIDAITGEILLFSPARTCVEATATGKGIGVTPLDLPVEHLLSVARDTSGGDFRLRDISRPRRIDVCDAAGSEELTGQTLAEALVSGVLSPATDPDGNWDNTVGRTSSQQPGVDALRLTGALYDWYGAVGSGRVGWDDNAFLDVANDMPLRVVVHAYDDYDKLTNLSTQAWNQLVPVGDKWCAYLAFSDGNVGADIPSGWNYSFLAGADTVVAHEYQHAITHFSFHDALGQPGLWGGDWHRALHEGLSDAFAGLHTGRWLIGLDVSIEGLPMRNLEFPSDISTWSNGDASLGGLAGNNLDHFDTHDAAVDPAYDRGTILGHCAFLLAEGGVHSRQGRSPVLIPVRALKRESEAGRSFSAAARVWYDALTSWLGAVGGDADDSGVFFALRDACLSAAAARYGTASEEYCTTALAFYAVGLQPPGVPYGPNVTFLSWGAAWALSRKYLGIVAPDWASPDLFVNNDGTTSEWNVLVNVTVAGVATTFENKLYCRVRNVGDQPATGVRVRFAYAKVGTMPHEWLPVCDAAGVEQQLDVGVLQAGEQTFSDAPDVQASPPDGTFVRWSIPPVGDDEVVDHYCVRATVSALNDTNPHDNTVQSNVAYVAYAPAFSVAMMASRSKEHKNAPELRVTATLPRSWELKPSWDRKFELKQGEKRPMRLTLRAPQAAVPTLEEPYDGTVRGVFHGELVGPFSGLLSDVRVRDGRLTGRLAAFIRGVGHFYGELRGRLDVTTATLVAKARGRFRSEANPDGSRVAVGVEAVLRPKRTIDIAHVVDGIAVGGVTIQIQVPAPGAKPAWVTAPTRTRVDPKEHPPPRPPRRGGKRRGR